MDISKYQCEPDLVKNYDWKKAKANGHQVRRGHAHNGGGLLHRSDC